MKKYVILLILIALTYSIFAMRNWKLYTNTSHMRDMVMYDGKLAVATWGGIEFLNLETSSFETKLNKLDGLSGNNVVTLANIDDQELMIAINDLCIDRYKNGIFDRSLTSELGLTSSRINKILVHNNLIFVGTNSLAGSSDGLIVFNRADNTLPFPRYVSTYAPDRRIYDIIIDEAEYLYLGTNRGISKVHIDSLGTPNAWKHQTIQAGVNVHSLDFHNNIIAIATNINVMYFDKADFLNTSRWNTPLQNNRFAKVKIDPNGNDFKIYAIIGAWGALEGGATHNFHHNAFFNPDTTFKSIAIISPNNHIDYLYYGENNNANFLWTATNLYFIDNNIYVTTWGDGLYIIDKGTLLNLPKPFLNSIHTNNITKTAIDKTGKIWVINGIRAGSATSQSATGVSSFDEKEGLWRHYTMSDRGLLANNIYAVGVDHLNRKWFGTWWTTPETSGVSILDDSNPDEPIWERINTIQELIERTISEIIPVDQYMWVTSWDGGKLNNLNLPGGINVINDELEVIKQIKPTGGNDFFVTTAHKVNNQAFVGTFSSGVMMSTNPNFSTGENSVWENVPALSGVGYIQKIDSFVGDNFTQVWFATGQDFYYNETRYGSTSWYKVDSMVKRQLYSSGSYSNNQLYYIDEERIFGGEPTSPTALKIDPFGRVWLGSTDKGLSMYDIYEDRYYNYITRNSPLPSDEITFLDYNGTTGLLYVGTKEGLVTLEIGKEEKITDTLGNIVVYPNPFRPTGANTIKIKNIDYDTLPIGKNECHIFDISGQIITTLKENRFFEFEWDGTNSSGKNCASGVYFYLLQTELNKSAKGKIVLIR